MIKLVGKAAPEFPESTLAQILESWIRTKEWDTIILASAYLNDKAAEVLEHIFDQSLETIKQRPRDVEFLIGTYQYFTEPKAIERLLRFGSEERVKDFFELHINCPQHDHFHIKCYVVLGHKGSSAVVGSLNLTKEGLGSEGELGVWIESDSSAVQLIRGHLNQYDKQPWEEILEDYKKTYTKYRRRQTPPYRPPKPKLPHKQEKRQLHVAPTTRTDEKLPKEVEKAVTEKYKQLKKRHSGLVKKHHIVLLDVLLAYSKEKVESLYPSCSWFDRHIGGEKEWGIGSRRALCQVETVASLEEYRYKHSVVFLRRRGYIEYEVTDEVKEKAEEYDVIRYDEDIFDHNQKPLAKNLEEFRIFIEKINKRVS